MAALLLLLSCVDVVYVLTTASGGGGACSERGDMRVGDLCELTQVLNVSLVLDVSAHGSRQLAQENLPDEEIGLGVDVLPAG